LHSVAQERKPDIVALGDVNVDIVARFPNYPAKGENVVALSSEFHCGGSAANTAVALARMGFPVSLIARIGCDPWGSISVQTLDEAGVTLSNLQQDASALTGLTYIVVTPDGERTMLGDRGANILTDPREIKEDEIGSARLFYLSGYALLAEPQRSAALLALRSARRHGLTLALDPGTIVSEAALAEIRSLLPGTGILLPNLEEARGLTGLVEPEKCLEAFLDLGVEAIALKLGRDGCLIGTGDVRGWVPGFPVAAQDSTGAGDNFAAGLLAAHMQGLSWRGAALVGNALGAIATTRAGGAGVATMIEEVRTLLGEHRLDPAFQRLSKAVREAIGFVERVADATG
jgi:ribokinase